MIKEIKSLKNDEFSIKLFNSFSQYIYNVDSINLIIGNNGSGKTKLIQSIIRDLASRNAPEEFIAEGPTDSLGLVYYSAAPFLKTFPGGVDGQAMFIDASLSKKSKQRFRVAAEEYVKVGQALDIARAMQSIRTFDFERAAYDVIRSLFPDARSSENLFQDRDDLEFLPEIEELWRAEENYRKCDQNYKKTQARLRDFVDGNLYKSRSVGVRDYDPNRLVERRSLLADQLERLAKLRLHLRAEVSESILKRIGPKNELQAFAWISFCCSVEGVTAYRRTQIARSFLDRMLDDGLMVDDGVNDWSNAYQSVQEFVGYMRQISCGDFEWDMKTAAITVHLPTLLAHKSDFVLEEKAHRFGLVHVGFDDLSSGEAAILHQLTSISNATIDLVDRGAQNIT